MLFITRIDRSHPSKAVLAKAVEILENGGLVVFPTETAYGLACDAQDASAVKRIFKAKKRVSGKPLPLIAATKAMARKAGCLDGMMRHLADAFWPGPLTVVVPAAKGFPKGVASARGEIAVRVSSDSTARALAKGLGRPIVATSANRSGHGPHHDILAVLRDLGDFPDMILDAGRLRPRTPSTLVRCGGEECEILRQGPVSVERLVKALRSCP